MPTCLSGARAGAGRFLLCASRRIRPISLGLSALAVTSALPAQAGQHTDGTLGLLATLSRALGGSIGSFEVMLLAVFGGAMSFAIMAASWMIRERSRITGENERLSQRVADLKAANDRNSALVNVADQRVVVWKGADESPVVLGGLSAASGAPVDDADFLAFGKWLVADAAATFDNALRRLRANGEGFDLPLQTGSGGVLEAQGRTSGGHAFVRFIELSGERAAYSNLEAEYARLLATFDAVQALFDRLPMPVWLSRKDGSLYWANSAYATAVDAADGVAAVDHDARLLDAAERSRIEAGQRDEGWFTGTVPAVVAGDRKMLDVVDVLTDSGTAAIAVDKSDVEQIRSTLEQTVASHAETLDQLATAIAIFDRERRLQFYNSSFRSLWDLDTAFLEGRPSNSAVLDAMRGNNKLPSQPDWRKWRDGQLEIYQALEPREEWWHLADGMTLRVVVNPHAPGGATWIFEDVTEELKLRSSYNSLMRVQGETLDHLSEAVAVFGSDGKLRLFNPVLVSMFGLESAKVEQDMHISALSAMVADRVDAGETWQDIASAITGYDDERAGHAGEFELKGGEVIEFTLVPLPQGQTMLTLVDVTAKVNVERALTERNEALEESDRLKNRFMQHVSYELRTPLTSISGFGELLGMEDVGKLNAKQSEYLGHINASARVLRTVIDDILDLATIDAGAMALELDRVELAPAVEETVDALNTVIDERGLSVDVDIAKNARALIADPVRIRQILYNLLSNAVSHSPDGGRIRVRAKANRKQVDVEISDQGPGVPADQRETIFGRFEGAQTGDRRKGTGLGLSIVKSFVELHGGTISVGDATGRGASFVCSFPRKPEGELEVAA